MTVRERSNVVMHVVALMMVVSISHLSEGTAAEPPVPLTDSGNSLLVKYADMLKSVQAEVEKALPAIEEQKKASLLKAREATKAAEAEANVSQRSISNIQTAKDLVDHAKGKWIGGAEKSIAQAEAALKQATTKAEREAAQQDLAKWQANKAEGIKALKERQEALEKAKLDEAKVVQASELAKAALAQAQTNELGAAKALLTNLDPFLTDDKLDAQLVKCAVLTNATPRGLAEFAQQGKEQEALVEKLLADTALMKQMLVAGGAKGGKYGQAMRIYMDIQKTGSRTKDGILQRLAMGTCLEHAEPVAQRNAASTTDAASIVDPVKRYLHYEKAYLNGELDPAFPTMTAWECRMIVDCETPDHVLSWGREMLRNYRPDHILNPDYGWRYSGLVRTDVTYRHSNEYKDTDSLEFFQNIVKNGGICGRRAFFGRFIVQSFGLPAWGVTQHAHAALGRWTPAGWVVNLGANWQFSWYEGRTGLDFLLETQARKYPQDYLKVLRAQWIGDALKEQKYNSMKNSGGLWNLLAHFEARIISANTNPVELSALGQELGESNESPAAKATAIAMAAITDADKKIVIDPNNVITIPAGACGGGAQPLKSFLGGQQLLCGGGAFSFSFDTPTAGKYALTARVVNVHDDTRLQLKANKAKSSIDMGIPFTCGLWRTTDPVEVTLAQGSNVLSFSKPSNSLIIKELTLTPVK